MPMTTDSGFQRPTFDELLVARRAAYERQFGAFPDDGVWARLAEIDADMVHSLHGHIEHEAKQLMPMYATGLYMDLWGNFLVGPRKVATASGGMARFLGADGAELPAGRRLTRSDGAEYEIITGAVTANGVVQVPVRAVLPGRSGNAAEGETLTLLNPVLGLDAAGSVSAPGLTGGTEAETADAYRARYLVRLREPPMGGNDTDYITWAGQVPGVTRAWVRRNGSGTGEVVVLAMMDDTYADGIPRGAGTPTYSGDLLAVFNHIRAQAPDPAVFYAKAPTKRLVDVTVRGLEPDTPEVRAAIQAELADLFRRKAAPSAVLRKSWLAEAVSIAAGEDGFDDLPSPVMSVACARDEIAVLGEVTYEP